MTVDRAAVAAWCNEHLGSHVNSKAQVLYGLSTVGIEVGEGDSGITLVAEGRSVTVATNSWQDDFDRLLGRGLGLLVIKPDAIEPVVFHDADGVAIDTLPDGNPVRPPAYAVVNDAGPPNGWYGSWLYDTPEARTARTIDGIETIGAIALLLTGTNPATAYQGRGTGFRAALEALQQAQAMAT